MTPGDSTDDGGGVELWVAITILLGVTLVAVAVTAGFLWVITPTEEPRWPNANFDAAQDTTTLTVDGERIEVTRVTFRHEGGDEIDPDELAVRVSDGHPDPFGLDADGRVATFDGDAVQKDDAVSVVAAEPTANGETARVDFAVESVDDERRLTDGNGTVLELEPGDDVRLVWTDGERASTLRMLEVEDGS